MYLYVRGLDFYSLSTIFPLDFGTVPIVWYFCLFILFCHMILVSLHAGFHVCVKCHHHGIAIIDITQQGPCMKQQGKNTIYYCHISCDAAS